MEDYEGSNKGSYEDPMIFPDDFLLDNGELREGRIKTLSNADWIEYKNHALIIHFAGERTVLGSGPSLGGFQTGLKAVFNQDGGRTTDMRAPTYEEHMRVVAREDLNLDPAACTGLSTAANMQHASIRQMVYDDFTVTVAATAGIDTNGGRVGDPSVWHCRNGEYIPVKPGTINIMIHIDAKLPPDIMVRALITGTEAKTAAIQELQLPSRYSHGLATGSGTDGMIIVSDPSSEVVLTNAGKHCKLGEYLGKAVKDAVKEALHRQTKAGYKRQHDIIRRLDRYGITKEILTNMYIHADQEPGLKDRFNDTLRDDKQVTIAALYAHLLDQIDWGLLSPGEAREMAEVLLCYMAGKDYYPSGSCTETGDAACKTAYQVACEASSQTDSEASSQDLIFTDREEKDALIRELVDRYLETFISIVTSNSSQG